MTNEEFLDVIKGSFATYLAVGTSRSTTKFESFHGHIVTDLKRILGAGFTI